METGGGMTDKSWLEALKPGDKVIIDKGHYGRSIATVERLTKTQIITDFCRMKFRKSDGLEVGGDMWLGGVIKKPTDEEITKIIERKRRKKLIAKINLNAVVSLPTDQLKQIVKWIDAKKEG